MEENETEQQEIQTETSRVVVALVNGQGFGPTTYMGRDEQGVYIQATAILKPRDGRGKPTEIQIPRFIPYGSLLFMDLLPDEGEEGEDEHAGHTH